MPAESLWRLALERTEHAVLTGALVPLQTRIEPAEVGPFVLRRLLSTTPKHLRSGGPKPNPFLPWEPNLELCRLGETHVLLLNKYPVQLGHVLLISNGWKPQSGWLDATDWQTLCHVNDDTTGLWFFNSCAAAGASQPHRHLQLLPRHASESNCPLEPVFLDWLEEGAIQERPLWNHALSYRRDPSDAKELEELYWQHCRRLGLGSPEHDPVPRAPYNLVLTDRWMLSVRRSCEHNHGFSINALGFAGYLLATEHSDVSWLRGVGGWSLLNQVADRASA